MPEARIESSLLKRTSSSTFGSSSETRSSIARRAIERLTRVSGSPLREREALITGAGGPPSRSRIAPRSAATASSSRSSTSSNSSSSGRWTTSSLAALLRIASTRFWRCSSAGSIAGRVLIADSSRTEKTRVPSGSRSSSSSPAASAQKVSVCSPRVITSPGRRRRQSRTGSPFSSVPFLLLRSLTQKPSPRCSIAAWWRESHWSGRKMSLSRERPIVHAVLRERVALAGAAGGLDGDLGHCRSGKSRFYRAGSGRDTVPPMPAETPRAARARARPAARSPGPRSSWPPRRSAPGSSRRPRSSPSVTGATSPSRSSPPSLLALVVQLNVWRVLARLRPPRARPRVRRRARPRARARRARLRRRPRLQRRQRRRLRTRPRGCSASPRRPARRLSALAVAARRRGSARRPRPRRGLARARHGDDPGDSRGRRGRAPRRRGRPRRGRAPLRRRRAAGADPPRRHRGRLHPVLGRAPPARRRLRGPAAVPAVSRSAVARRGGDRRPCASCSSSPSSVSCRTAAALDPANPPASAFRLGAGEWGYRLFGLVLWSAASPRSSAARTRRCRSPRARGRASGGRRGAAVTAFVGVSLAAFLAIGRPVRVLVLAGALNGLDPAGHARR